MVEDKIKLGYLVAAPELRCDETVTAYQGDMETAVDYAAFLIDWCGSPK